ncbi:MAG TPA: hypothetical protein VFS39_14905 [Nitrospira sp.]|nr:hypothetical protein [Nitrospira sp.]
MVPVRPFGVEDLEAVAQLHARVFNQGWRHADDLRRRATYLRQVFLEHRDVGCAVPSYVAEEQGRVLGFLGVAPRRFLYMEKPVLAAVCTQFIADPVGQSRMVGIQLLSTCLRGPQDLTIADEANNAARILWEGFGGTTALLYSLSWTRILRPAGYVVSLIGLRRGWRSLARVIRPASRLLDTVAAHGAGGPLRPPVSTATGTVLSDASAPEDGCDYHDGSRLRPDLPNDDRNWLLRRAADKPCGGTLTRVRVSSGREGVVGWYLYYVNPGGISEVVTIAAKSRARGVVFTHLLQHAWHGGAIAVSGRVLPQWMPALSEHRCFFSRGPWVLVHSRRPDIVQTFHEGTASSSRLEGEWCLGYQ